MKTYNDLELEIIRLRYMVRSLVGLVEHVQWLGKHGHADKPSPATNEALEKARKLLEEVEAIT